MKTFSTLRRTGFALALPVAACVYADAPMGVEPITIDAQEWDGTWILAGGTASSRVVDPVGGVLELEGLDLENTEGPQTVTLRQARGAILASVPSEDGYYLWGLVTRRDDQVVVFFPAAERFAELVRDGRLPGRIEEVLTGESVYLEGLEGPDLDRILEERDGVLFDWLEPGALIRRGERRNGLEGPSMDFQQGERQD